MAKRKTRSSNVTKSSGSSGRTRGASGGSSSRTGSGGGAKSQVTTDHAKIQKWVEARGGMPACVLGAGGGGDAGMLRIDFPATAEMSRSRR